MARVIDIIDSRTLVVDTNGRRSAAVLRGISVEQGEEAAATAYLHQLVDRAWVYIEDGAVYRSPDGLYVNGEMQRRAWRTIAGMRYLGEASPAPAATPQLRPAKAASPSAARSRAPLPPTRSRRRK